MDRKKRPMSFPDPFRLGTSISLMHFRIPPRRHEGHNEVNVGPPQPHLTFSPMASRLLPASSRFPHILPGCEKDDAA
jgi:hypothetical protein